LDGLSQKHAVEAARAGPGHNVGHHPQMRARSMRKPGQQIDIDPFTGQKMVGILAKTAGAGQFPHFLGHAMHVNRKADPAVTDQSETKLFVPHRQAGPIASGWRQSAKSARREIPLPSPDRQAGQG
ncbi:hypothetical protein E4T56_gene9135, partial [Termitomyces sp. T112]